MSDGTVVIKKGREKPIVNRHPWIFSGAISQVEGNPPPGEIVTVVAHNGEFFARGYWNPKSQIQVRILTWQDEAIDRNWWQRMLKQAIDARELCMIPCCRGEPVAYRVVNAENDFLPGLIVDRYADWLVVQTLTLGIDHRKTMLVELLDDLLQPLGIYERSDVDIRDREALGPVTGVLWGKEPPQYIDVCENDLNIHVDVRTGHKTGLYLDQSDNRRYLRELLIDQVSGVRRVLNLFSYTGGFGLHASAVHGTRVSNVDSSRDVLELAEENVRLNHFPSHDVVFIQADVFQHLRDLVERSEQYDMVILDPPKFAHNKQQIAKAARGYKDINLNAFRVVKPGGYVMTFSCSGVINAQLFQQIVFGALVDSGRQAQIIRHLGPSADHPVALTFPEGAYLKGLLLRVY